MFKRVLGIATTLTLGVTAAPAAFAEVSLEASGEATTQPADSAATAQVAQVDTTAPAPEEAAPAEPTAEAPAPAEPAAEEEAAAIPGWFRMDHDGLGLQLWFGATHSLGGLDLATDIYVDSGTFAEFDIGPVLTLGESVTITPMVGIGFDWSSQSISTLIAPQFFTIANLDSIYIEQWTQGFFSSPFTDGAADNLYLRNQLFLKVSDDVAIGPQVELTLALNDVDSVDDMGMTVTVERETLASLAPGLGTNIAYGTNNTLGLWLGMETVEDAQVPDSDKIVGRFTFVRTW